LEKMVYKDYEIKYFRYKEVIRFFKTPLGKTRRTILHQCCICQQG